MPCSPAGAAHPASPLPNAACLQGAWEGRVRSKCFTPELTAQFAADPWGAAWEFQPPGGGESQKEVEERMTAYLAGQVR